MLSTRTQFRPASTKAGIILSVRKKKKVSVEVGCLLSCFVVHDLYERNTRTENRERDERKRATRKGVLGRKDATWERGF